MRVSSAWAMAVACAVGTATASGCVELPRDAETGETHVVFDPTAGKIPLPNDLVRDAEANHLSLPIPADTKPAERELREFMNTHDAWPTTFGLSAEVSSAVDEQSLAENLLLFEWIGTNEDGRLSRLRDIHPRLEKEGTKIVVDAPVEGWKRGARYLMAVRGGKNGLRDVHGRVVGPDKIFYFLRANEKLDTYENAKAFPGDTRAARMETAKKLEDVRQKLLPFFEGLEKSEVKLDRKDVSALWSWTITKNTELAMDKTSQRMPLPFDVLVDPKTKLISLPANAKDTALEASAKLQFNKMNGFGTASSFDFQLTQAVDPATATPKSVRVFRMPEQREIAVADVKVFATDPHRIQDCKKAPDEQCTRLSVTVPEEELPLRAATTYAIVVTDAMKARDGGPIRPMLMGHFVKAEHPLVEGGESQIAALDLETAERLEGVRTKVAPLLATLGRDHVVAAWPFTTLDSAPRLVAAKNLAESLNLDPTPKVTKKTALKPGLLGAADQSEIDAFDGLFPGPLTGQVVGTVYVPRVRGVRQIVEGTVKTPLTLDRTTRQTRADGKSEEEDIHFLLTLPEAPAGKKVPVVMFGHGLMTDRRFVLTVAGKLAQKGFAAISFDFPFHGERTVCTSQSLIAIPNFLPKEIRSLDRTISGDLLSFPPCPSGSSCEAGKCVTPGGEVKELSRIPLTDMIVAGGAALIDVDDIAHISDRMFQAVTDMGTVRRMVKLADWKGLTGVELETDKIWYSGQSLGGILGAIFVSVSDDVEHAVLNVPGADEVDLFQQSTYFAPQMDAFFQREKLEKGSYERERLINMARWLIDAVDPQALAHLLGQKSAWMQMCKGDIIIPNFVTERLERASKLQMKTYPSPLHGDLVMPILGDDMLDDLAGFLVDGKAR